MVHKNHDEFQGISWSRSTRQEVEVEDNKYKYKTRSTSKSTRQVVKYKILSWFCVQGCFPPPSQYRTPLTFLYSIQRSWNIRYYTLLLVGVGELHLKRGAGNDSPFRDKISLFHDSLFLRLPLGVRSTGYGQRPYFRPFFWTLPF